MLLREEFAFQLRRAKRQAKIQAMQEIRLQLDRELNSAHNLKRQSELSSPLSSNKGHPQAAVKAAELWQNKSSPQVVRRPPKAPKSKRRRSCRQISRTQTPAARRTVQPKRAYRNKKLPKERDPSSACASHLRQQPASASATA